MNVLGQTSVFLCQGWGENDRGVSYTFGADVVQKFLNKHDMDLIARAHQVVGAYESERVLARYFFNLMLLRNQLSIDRQIYGPTHRDARMQFDQLSNLDSPNDFC